jgi:hypothetical protein
MALGEDGVLDLARLSGSWMNCRQVHQALRIAVALARRDHPLHRHTRMVLKQEHLEKGLAATMSTRRVRERDRDLAGRGQDRLVGSEIGAEGVAQRTREKPRVWQDS